ncbi:hypothetical protein T05_15249 [Trichinella murrelli]|uniref:Uncharacterized protein n=1 Tax=Trichinella murrelli TaxID=144512 RepID=A0A0V0SYI6_9BILA|nr:hypothetical protein T05_15249 [Trichinella murrelli]
MNNEEKEKGKHRRFVKQADHGRHETDHRRHEAEQGKTKGICGSPWVPILIVCRLFSLAGVAVEGAVSL